MAVRTSCSVRPANSRVDVVGRVPQQRHVVERLVGVDHLVRDLPAGRDHDHEHALASRLTKSMCRSRTDGPAGAARTRRDARRATVPATRSPAGRRPCRPAQPRLESRAAAATACATRAASRRTGGSRSRSARVRPRCAAGARAPAPRAAPGCCARSPTTARARCARPATPTTPARPARCTPPRGGPESAAGVRLLCQAQAVSSLGRRVLRSSIADRVRPVRPQAPARTSAARAGEALRVAAAASRRSSLPVRPRRARRRVRRLAPSTIVARTSAGRAA